MVDVLDERHDVPPFRHEHGAAAVRFGLRHQPKAHLRDDAEIRLAEQARDIRPEAVLVVGPRGVVGERGHAGAHELAVRQHDLHAAVAAEVIAILAERVADAVIERVADDAAPTGVGRIDPELELALLNVAVEIEVDDAGLDDRAAAPFVDGDDAVHALQIDDDAARQDRRRAAVAQVLARRDRVQRQLVLVRDAHDLLHLLDVDRRDGGRREPFRRLVAFRRVRVAIERDVLVGLEHPLLADGGFELAQRGSEIRGADTLRRGWHRVTSSAARGTTTHE